MDLIADLIAKIKNNINAKIPVLNVQANKLNTNLCDVMKKEGYIVDYKITEVDKKKFIDVTLNIKKNPIHGIKQVSKSSLRIYTDSKEIPKVWNGLGISIISTSKGVMTGKQAAIENLGGEVIAFVW